MESRLFRPPTTSSTVSSGLTACGDGGASLHAGRRVLPDPSRTATAASLSLSITSAQLPEHRVAELHPTQILSREAAAVRAGTYALWEQLYGPTAVSLSVERLLYARATAGSDAATAGSFLQPASALLLDSTVVSSPWVAQLFQCDAPVSSLPRAANAKTAHSVTTISADTQDNAHKTAATTTPVALPSTYGQTNAEAPGTTAPADLTDGQTGKRSDVRFVERVADSLPRRISSHFPPTPLTTPSLQRDDGNEEEEKREGGTTVVLRPVLNRREGRVLLCTPGSLSSPPDWVLPASTTELTSPSRFSTLRSMGDESIDRGESEKREEMATQQQSLPPTLSREEEHGDVNAEEVESTPVMKLPAPPQALSSSPSPSSFSVSGAENDNAQLDLPEHDSLCDEETEAKRRTEKRETVQSVVLDSSNDDDGRTTPAERSRCVDEGRDETDLEEKKEEQEQEQQHNEDIGFVSLPASPLSHLANFPTTDPKTSPVPFTLTPSPGPVVNLADTMTAIRVTTWTQCTPLFADNGDEDEEVERSWDDFEVDINNNNDTSINSFANEESVTPVRSSLSVSPTPSPQRLPSMSALADADGLVFSPPRRQQMQLRLQQRRHLQHHHHLQHPQPPQEQQQRRRRPREEDDDATAETSASSPRSPSTSKSREEQPHPQNQQERDEEVERRRALLSPAAACVTTAGAECLEVGAVRRNSFDANVSVSDVAFVAVAEKTADNTDEETRCVPPLAAEVLLKLTAEEEEEASTTIAAAPEAAVDMTDREAAAPAPTSTSAEASLADVARAESLEKDDINLVIDMSMVDDRAGSTLEEPVRDGNARQLLDVATRTSHTESSRDTEHSATPRHVRHTAAAATAAGINNNNNNVDDVADDGGRASVTRALSSSSPHPHLEDGEEAGEVVDPSASPAPRTSLEEAHDDNDKPSKTTIFDSPQNGVDARRSISLLDFSWVAEADVVLRQQQARLQAHAVSQGGARSPSARPRTVAGPQLYYPLSSADSGALARFPPSASTVHGYAEGRRYGRSETPASPTWSVSPQPLDPQSRFGARNLTSDTTSLTTTVAPVPSHNSTPRPVSDTSAPQASSSPLAEFASPATASRRAPPPSCSPSPSRDPPSPTQQRRATMKRVRSPTCDASFRSPVMPSTRRGKHHHDRRVALSPSPLPRAQAMREENVVESSNSAAQQLGGHFSRGGGGAATMRRCRARLRTGPSVSPAGAAGGAAVNEFVLPRTVSAEPVVPSASPARVASPLQPRSVNQSERSKRSRPETVSTQGPTKTKTKKKALRKEEGLPNKVSAVGHRGRDDKLAAHRKPSMVTLNQKLQLQKSAGKETKL